MHIIIGRGGNQKQKITDPKIATCHCIIWGTDTPGEYEIEPLNVKPTLVDGRRIFTKVPADGNTRITLGDTFDAKVKDIVKEMFDLHSITDWGVAADRFATALSVEVFQQFCWREYADDIAADNSIMLCKAFRLIEDGRLRAAQELLYEAGDALYENQDGSDRMRDAYAAALVLAALLYDRIGRSDAAQEARNGARSMIASGATCSPFVMEYIK